MGRVLCTTFKGILSEYNVELKGLSMFQLVMKQASHENGKKDEIFFRHWFGKNYLQESPHSIKSLATFCVGNGIFYYSECVQKVVFNAVYTTTPLHSHGK